MLPYKSILVTGGTGSFGKTFVKRILTHFPEVERLAVFSRDELKQFEMAQEFSTEKYQQLRYFIGDVRDEARLLRAFENIDVVVHAAALKQVPTAEYNPMECIKTNVLGAENVINAAIKSGVKRVVALSTDKAAAPINLYGASKLCSDKLFVAANNFRGNRDINFSVVRYGNVIGSRGSVMPFFLNKRTSGTLPITHEEMTRFNISLEEGVDLVLYAMHNAWGGEIFVPKIPSYRIMDVAEAIAPGAKHDIIGIRPGEKLHEEMITEMDSFNTLELDKYYVIAPSVPLWSHDEYLKKFGGKKVKQGFKYNSGENPDFMTVEQIRTAIREHIDQNFIPQA
jgi:UDP-N-acetylglucosamine 4,6-dehydratase (inverting)